MTTTTTTTTTKPEFAVGDRVSLVSPSGQFLGNGTVRSLIPGGTFAVLKDGKKRPGYYSASQVTA